MGNRIKNIEEVEAYWDNAFDKKGFPYYAFLLYTGADVNFTSYIRKNYSELSDLSGDYCLFFLIDDPEIEGDLENIDSNKHVEQSRQSQAYYIADKMNVPFNKLPCLVFFRDINDKKVLIYHLNTNVSNENITEQFRELFTAIKMCVLDAREYNENLSTDVLQECLSKYIQKGRRKEFLRNLAKHPIVTTVGSILKSLISK